jgi:hypothetical protein
LASIYRASTTDLPRGRSLLTVNSTDHPEEVTMKSHRCRGHVRALILTLVTCAALAAPAAAEPGADYPQPSSTKIGDTPADFAQPVARASDSKAKAGETAGDIATGLRWTALARSYAAAPKVGDTPVDDPGASRAPKYTEPTTIQVVRPERTIVRNVDQVLPVVLSSAALLLVLSGSAFLLVTSMRRRRLGH